MGKKLLKDFWEEVDPLPDRPEPKDGWKPVCKVEDHLWKVQIEGGNVHLECLDPHTIEEANEMEPTGAMIGCDLGGEHLIAEFGPFKLEWHTESYGWEYPNEYDSWVEVVEKRVDSNGS